MEDRFIARKIINLFNKAHNLAFLSNSSTKVNYNLVKLFNTTFDDQFKDNPLYIGENIKLENISFKSQDNINLSGTIYRNPVKTNKWIIGLHGYSSSGIAKLFSIWNYRELGYNLMVFDFRCHGNSENDVITLGYKENWDLKAAVEYLWSNEVVELIGISGTSMGAFTLNYFSVTEEEFIRKHKIKFGISDSTFLSAPRALEYLISHQAPTIFGNYLSVIKKDIIDIYREEKNVNLENLDYLKLIPKNLKSFPILLIHTIDDNVTHYQDSVKIYEAKNKAEKNPGNEIKLFESGGHTKAIVKNYDEYMKVSNQFIINNQ
ncbi:alpha/beta hydrolase [Spiroplasma endosymbiont of Panorpa germanica]|uniref:alpha/beta hydrolase n=1 Tax=Spiroplasma endosymbiont of Panorpa germanica TaxID=3066314 RepID=UPI0030CA5C7F